MADVKFQRIVEPTILQEGIQYGTELFGFAKETAKDAVMSAVGDSPLGVLEELFQVGKNGTPIFSNGPSPAETLRTMKEKTVRGIRVHSDLEVMFSGMAFIIRLVLQHRFVKGFSPMRAYLMSDVHLSGGLKTITQAVQTLKQLESLGHPSCLWVLMPWKVSATKALKEELDRHSQVM